MKLIGMAVCVGCGSIAVLAIIAVVLCVAAIVIHWIGDVIHAF